MLTRRSLPALAAVGILAAALPPALAEGADTAQATKLVQGLGRQLVAVVNGPGTVAEKQASRVKAPPMFQVVLLNDDFTPMEFVVGVLQKFFGKGREQATQIMLKVHHEGRGVCGVYPRDIAASKVEQVPVRAPQALEEGRGDGECSS